MPIMPCNLILTLVIPALFEGYLCVIGVGNYVLTFPLSSQEPEVGDLPLFLPHSL